MKTWLAVLISAGCVATAQQAPDASERRTIVGRAIDAQTHEAVRRAAIKIYTSKGQWDEFTDGEGRFRFVDLVPGDYTLIAHRDGYTDRAYQLERSYFEGPRELLIEIHRQGAITGRVLNTPGHPLQGAKIEALSSQAAGASIDVAAATETSDLGEYRLSGLDPGTYQVRVTYREGTSGDYDRMPDTIATSYYGGSENPAGVAVKAGSVLTGIDFVLDPVRPAQNESGYAFRVRVVDSITRNPVMGANVTLAPAALMNGQARQVWGRTDASGVFAGRAPLLASIF